MSPHVADVSLSKSLEKDTSLITSCDPNLSANLVYFRKDDPACPFYWSQPKKLCASIFCGERSVLMVGAVDICGLMCLQIFWLTSIGTVYSPSADAIAREFGIAPLLARVPQATYLLGFAVGASHAYAVLW